MGRVRIATGADVRHIIDCVKMLCLAVDGAQAVNEPWTGATISRLIHSDNAAVFVSDGGFIAGEILQTVISPAPVAFEHGWFASDRSGVRLLAVFEAWAKDSGAEIIRMSSGADSSGVAALLQRRGYSLAELSYIKKV